MNQKKKKAAERDQRLQTLYLESESFPVELVEAEEIMLMLK